MTSEIQTVKLIACALNLGELHQPNDIGFYRPVFRCVTETGDQFTASMRLHITQPLSPLVIADPRAFPDGGVAVNSTGSRALNRRASYENAGNDASPVLRPDDLRGAALYQIPEEEIRRAVLNGYDHAAALGLSDRTNPGTIAFTCHDPGVIGGGNAILFRFVNWLADLGVKVTIYSCGRHPFWTRVNARVRLFSSYRSMCDAIEEDTVVLFSMWHVEPMLQAHAAAKKRIFHLRQICESFHYGNDYVSMAAKKPVIELLEALPLGVITISPHLHKWYKQNHGLESLLVTNGISLRSYFPAQERVGRGDACRVVSVGDPRHFVKGADVLGRALRMLAERKPSLTIEWTVASGSPAKVEIEGSRIPPNLSVVNKSGLAPAEMRKLYQTATVVVNPSLYEGFGLPTLEAMACGAPVVHADNMGLDSIVEDEKNCLVVPVNNPAALTEAIGRIIEDRVLAKRLGAAGKETAQRHTTADQLSAFVPAFQQVLGVQFPVESTENLRSEIAASSGPVRTEDRRPLVSVVIPSYNQAGYLRQALDSLLAQTYSNWEGLVVNDGSTDDTAAVMEEYARKDARIRPFTKQNGGITSALNAGLEQARGEFFCWLSSDDLFYPEKLEWQVQAFAELEESYVLVYGSFDILNEPEGKISVQPFQEPLTAGAEFPEALKFDFIDGCTIMIRMSVMREVGGFNGYYRHSQDMELWVRIASRGYRFRQLERKLTIRRVHRAQSSTGNMIHCRFDAAWMINYYLDHFHLLELYRYFDLASKRDIQRFMAHLVGRMTHTESNVNHPLLQDKFWCWFVRGVRALPVQNQTSVLRACMRQLLAQRHTTPKMEYFIAACSKELARPVEMMPYDPVYSIAGRNIREDNREHDSFGEALFEYGCDLLVNSHTPLFAQELYFHNTNKVVDTPFKLAHSVFRYLSQFPNTHRERVTPVADLTHVPLSDDEALDLFCRLRYPAIARDLHESRLFNAAHSSALDVVEEHERRIAAMPPEYEKDLRHVCGKNPTSTILFYWLALTAAAKGNFKEALDLGWRTMTVGQRSCDWSMAFRIGTWAERAGDDERALSAYSMAAGACPAFSGASQAMRRVAGSRHPFRQRMPVPQKFIQATDDHPLADAQLTSYTFTPRLDGTCDVHCSALSDEGVEFYSRARMPYAPDFETQVITDPKSGKAYKVTAANLFRFWSAGYDYDRESRAYLSTMLASDHPPRVAFTVLNSSVMGGGTRILYRFVEWLVELGIGVAVYSNDDPPTWLPVRAEFHKIPDAAQRYKAITEQTVIVYSVFEMPNVLRHCCGTGKRILHFSQVVEDFNYHGFTVESLMAPKSMIQILQSLPVGRLAISEHIWSYFSTNYSQNSYRIVNGVDLTTWKQIPIFPSTLHKAVLTIGNPRRLMKGASDVRQAMAVVAKRHPEWTLHLSIISGERIADYPTDTAALGFTTSLRCGLTPDEMKEEYRNADVYVNAAWYEGFGLPGIEAMACGVPVVQADNCGLDGIVNDGVNCLLVKPGSPGKMAEAVEKILSDEILRKGLISEGHKSADALSTAAQFKMFVPVFEDLLGVCFDRTAVARMESSLRDGDQKSRVAEAVKEMTPTFSVLVPVYNQAGFLPAALDSLRAQTYPNWEAIVVNDGSTDDTARVLEEYTGREPRIKPYHKKNGGVASALNFALRHATGEWVCWLSSDDFFRPEKLQIHYEEIERNPDVKFFHTHYHTLDEQSKKLLSVAPHLAAMLPAPEERVISFFQTNCVNGITVCIHRSVFDEVGFFHEDLRCGQDFDMWLRISARHALKFINSRTCVYRLHNGQDSHSAPDAGVFDSARASVAFLNEHPWPAIFPSLTLTDPAGIIRAVRTTLAVAAHPQSFLNQLGCAHVLLDRLHEWISGSCPPPLQNQLHSQIAQVIRDAESSSVDPRIQGAFRSLRNAGIDSFTYSKHDPLEEARSFAAECEGQGKIEKGKAIRAYLEKTLARGAAASLSPSFARSDRTGRIDVQLAPPPDLLDECRQLFERGLYREALTKVGEIASEISTGTKSDGSEKVLENLSVFSACCMLALDDLEGAKSAFQQVLEINPGSSPACSGLGSVLERAGWNEAAKTMYEWGVKNDPSNRQAIDGLARVNRQLGHPEAHSSLDENSPAEPSGSLNKTLEDAYRFFEQCLYREALECVTAVERLIDPNLSEEARAAVTSSIENFRGFNFLGLQNLEEAKACFEKGLQANPQSSQACAGLGEVFHLSGMEREAKTMYEWAVRCDPGNPAAVKGLAKVNSGLGLPAEDNSVQTLSQDH